ncbi:hypothetical protein ACS0TY_027070 [Phlomoides rotata]
MQIGPSSYLDLERWPALVIMEIEEKEKIVIAKPVACRPHVSRLKSFSELLSGAVNSSIPRTTRFKPAHNSDIVGADERGSAARNQSEKAPESNATFNVVYKPIAKLVSKTTVPLLANLGGHGITRTREIAEIGARIQPSNQANLQTDSIVEFNVPPQEEQKANAILENSEDNNKSSLLANIRDRPSYDGHSWRKYGQKQVKGSEFPRSYYKCTYPNCPMKKKVEKTLDGQIAEIVYKGEHNHSKPQPLSRTPAKNHMINQQDKIVKDHEGRSENKDITESSTFSPIYYPVIAAECIGGPSTSNNSLGRSGECEEVREFFEAGGDDFKSKRTKCDNRAVKAGTVGEASPEPQIVVQKSADSSITGDGFRWRKYGQKVVKGKMYPRSYYRCTNPDCNVRKYVERMSEDPATFMTTYEGKHSHPIPIHTNAELSKTSTKNKL